VRRIALVACAVVLGAVGAACIPESPPPPLYQVPVVQGVSSSPDPARPGEPVTISVDVVDDETVSDVDIYGVIVPSGATLPGVPPCTTAIQPGAEAGHATVDITCDVPAYASNGTWKLDVRFFDRPEPGPGEPSYAYTGLRTTVPFVVAGGTDDTSPPLVLDWSTDPAVVRHDAPFTLTLHLEDQAPIVASPNPFGAYDFVKPFATQSRFACAQPSLTVLSPTEGEVRITCTPSHYGVLGVAEVGPHRGIVPLGDALGHQGSVELWIDAT
jgi:hypothetical protein